MDTFTGFFNVRKGESKNFQAGLLKTTTDATWTTVMSIKIPLSVGMGIEAKVIGIKNDASQGANYVLKGTYRNNAGTLSAIGTPTSAHLAEDDAAWDARFNVNGQKVEVQVKGKAATTIRWTARAEKTYVRV